MGLEHDNPLILLFSSGSTKILSNALEQSFQEGWMKTTSPVNPEGFPMILAFHDERSFLNKDEEGGFIATPFSKQLEDLVGERDVYVVFHKSTKLNEEEELVKHYFDPTFGNRFQKSIKSNSDDGTLVRKIQKLKKVIEAPVSTLKMKQALNHVLEEFNEAPLPVLSAFFCWGQAYVAGNYLQGLLSDQQLQDLDFLQLSEAFGNAPPLEPLHWPLKPPPADDTSFGRYDCAEETWLAAEAWIEWKRLGPAFEDDWPMIREAIFLLCYQDKGSEVDWVPILRLARPVQILRPKTGVEKNRWNNEYQLYIHTELLNFRDTLSIRADNQEQANLLDRNELLELSNPNRFSFFQKVREVIQKAHKELCISNDLSSFKFNFEADSERDQMCRLLRPLWLHHSRIRQIEKNCLDLLDQCEVELLELNALLAQTPEVSASSIVNKLRTSVAMMTELNDQVLEKIRLSRFLIP